MRQELTMIQRQPDLWLSGCPFPVFSTAQLTSVNCSLRLEQVEYA